MYDFFNFFLFLFIGIIGKKYVGFKLVYLFDFEEIEENNLIL